MKEVRAVLNSQPLPTELLSDNNNLNPICPSNLLTVKSKVVMSPPSELLHADSYIVRKGGGENKI